LLFPLIVPFFVLGVKAKPSKEEKFKLDLKRCCIYLLFFTLFVVSLIGFLPLWIGIVIPLYVVLFDRKTLLVDYGLLLTFLAFFGFSDNLSSFLKDIPLKDSKGVFWSAVLGSQIFSNVPTALILGGLIKPTLKNALLWGVNAGGFGTLVGSMANLIAYRLYTSIEGNRKRALIWFHIFGFTFLCFAILLYSL